MKTLPLLDLPRPFVSSFEAELCSNLDIEKLLRSAPPEHRSSLVWLWLRRENERQTAAALKISRWRVRQAKLWLRERLSKE